MTSTPPSNPGSVVVDANVLKSFEAQMKAILQPPGGDAALITKAEEMRKGYGCGRSADSIYLALAWELSR